jgi:hypothetical protein
VTLQAPAVNEATIDYCRRARRLRGRLAGQPSRLHQALGRLNETAPVASRAPALPVSEMTSVRVRVCPAVLLGVSPDREAAVRRFVEYVRSYLAIEPNVTADVRASLLRAAGRMRIERFHANLVIAAVVHEFAAPVRPVVPATRLFAMPAWLTVVITQAIIVAATILLWVNG